MRIKINYEKSISKADYAMIHYRLYVTYIVFLPLGLTFLRADVYSGLSNVYQLCQLTSMFSSVYHVILGLGWNVNLLLA